MSARRAPVRLQDSPNLLMTERCSFTDHAQGEAKFVSSEDRVVKLFASTFQRVGLAPQFGEDWRGHAR